MDVLFQSFIDSLENAATVGQFSEALAAMAAGFGLHTFAYLCAAGAPNGKPLLISNYAEGWASHYFARRYFGSDPVILRAWQTREPFEWGPDFSRGASLVVRNFFDEAACFGIRYGYTIPIRCWRGRSAALTFASDRFRSPYRTAIRQNTCALQAIACQFHARVRENLGVRHVTGDIELTFRQRQCLELAEEGKSFGEIAELTGISPHTVKFHIDNVKRKFGVRTIREAAIYYTLAKRARGEISRAS